MKKVTLKKDNDLLYFGMILTAIILIIVAGFLVCFDTMNKKIGKLEVENYNLFCVNRHAENVDKTYEGKIEMLEVENDILEVSNEILTEDATFLSYIARDILLNYGVDIEEKIEEYDSLIIDLFNYARLFMPYNKATDFSDDIKDLQADYIEFQDSYDEEFEMFTPEDLVKY